MIKSIRLVNYKAFRDITFDLTDKSNKIKNLAFIYGENGAGKSALVSSIVFLKDSINSLNFKSKLEKIMAKNDGFMSSEELKYLIKDSSIEASLQRVFSINSECLLYVVYNFVIHKKIYEYSLTCDKHSFVSEKLTVDNSLIFSIEKGKIEVSNISTNKEYLDTIIAKIKQYYGIHSLLSIMLFEFQSTNKEFIKENINPCIKELIDEIIRIVVVCKEEYSPIGEGFRTKGLLRNIINGEITENEIPDIKTTENVLNIYVGALCSNVLKVFYKTKKEENKFLTYDLYIERLENGKKVDIPWNLESTGTIGIIKLLPLIIKAVKGETVFFDEMDSSIHDLLFQFVIEQVKDKITGQLISTTHNTKLLETIKPKSAYILSIDTNGNRTINSIDNITDKRIQQHNNMNYQYLHGLFGGVPVTGYFDVDSLLNSLEKKNDSEK